MIVMHGLFDLAEGHDEQQFAVALECFVDYLKANDLAVSARFMRRQAHAGYNSDAPETGFCVTVDFTDMAMAERCWHHVERDEEPLKSLHTAVFSPVRNSRFFLDHVVWDGPG